MADRVVGSSQNPVLRVGHREIRPFRDFVELGPRPSDDHGGYIPGGSYERGKFSALDRALDRLKEDSKRRRPKR
jgi:hypothetical protein